MGKTNHKKDKKKKGSSGKKARAKAKLERHWGETVNEDDIQKNKIRKGKSRFMTSIQKKNNPTIHNHTILEDTVPTTSTNLYQDTTTSDDESISLSENENELEIDNNPLNLLLNRIQPLSKKQTRKNYKTMSMAISDDDDDSSSDEEEEEDNEMEQDTIIANNNVVDVDNDTNVLDEFTKQIINEENHPNDEEEKKESKETMSTTKVLDTFGSHFQREPFSETSTNEHLLKIRGTKHTKIEFTLSLDVIQMKNDNNDSTSTVTSIDYLKSLRPTLLRHWSKFNQLAIHQNADSSMMNNNKNNHHHHKAVLSCLQSLLLPSMLTYMDMQLPIKTRENHQAIQNITILHLLHHVLTSRSRVSKHNTTLDSNKNNCEKESLMIYRDQGYTRPKVLILLPTRGTCHSFVQRMVSLLGGHDDNDTATVFVDNYDRFQDDFSPQMTEEEKHNDDNDRYRKSVLKSKGKDWQELFGDDVNSDDEFKVGISLTSNASSFHQPKKKKNNSNKKGISMKLYSEFYKSDIIIASPLGLKLACTSKGGEEGDNDDDDNGGDNEDVDFLSSIEICIVDHCDVMLMQNWDHVVSSLESLNQQPSKINKDTDYSRVRNYLLAGQAAYWKQLIMISSFADPNIQSTFKRHSTSYQGCIKMRRKIPTTEDASMSQVLLYQLKQVFTRIQCDSVSSQTKDRLSFFTDKVLPKLRQMKQKHTLIYVPSYFDFIALRNYLLKKEIEFVSVTEYARVSEVGRGRARFLQGRKPIMLYTGRAHYFLRHAIKGAKHVIFFGLPEHAEFYPKIINNITTVTTNDGEEEEQQQQISHDPSCLVLFTKYEAHALERIVGTSHCNQMIKSDKSTFVFRS